jgi:hypothetical protein
VLLYVSLILDSISVAFQDRTAFNDQNDGAVFSDAAINGIWILLQLYLVWLSAHQRKGWPRWVLAANLLLAGTSLLQFVAENGLQVDSAIEIISFVLTVVAIVLSFTGDARAWFKE